MSSQDGRCVMARGFTSGPHLDEHRDVERHVAPHKFGISQLRAVPHIHAYCTTFTAIESIKYIS